jgi:hypothetical protein
MRSSGGKLVAIDVRCCDFDLVEGYERWCEKDLRQVE